MQSTKGMTRRTYVFMDVFPQTQFEKFSNNTMYPYRDTYN